jgi:hypothetical protein
MTTLEEAIRELRASNEPVPNPALLPSEAEVDAIEVQLKVKFHSDFREYLLKASDVVCGNKEPVTIDVQSHTNLAQVAEAAWAVGLPKDYIPICEDNGDYFAMTPKGEVVYWSHNGLSDEKWSSLANWIFEVWLESR